MKRTIKPFVVERKRRAARASGAPVSIWSEPEGEAFRILKDDRGEGATFNKGDMRPMTRAASRPLDGEGTSSTKPRILQADARTPVIDAPISNTSLQSSSEQLAKLPRRYRKPGVESQLDQQRVVDQVSITLDAAAMPSHRVQPIRPTATIHSEAWRGRRAAARKKLPLHERWKWDLPI